MYEPIDLYGIDSPPIYDPKTHEEYIELRDAEEAQREKGNLQFIRDRYLSYVELEYDARAPNIFESFRKRTLETIYDIEEAMSELSHFIKNKGYYVTLERIENGERMRDEEPDKAKRDYYGKILDGLYAELELHMPKEEAA